MTIPKHIFIKKSEHISEGVKLLKSKSSLAFCSLGPSRRILVFVGNEYAK